MEAQVVFACDAILVLIPQKLKAHLPKVRAARGVPSGCTCPPGKHYSLSPVHTHLQTSSGVTVQSPSNRSWQLARGLEVSVQ